MTLIAGCSSKWKSIRILGSGLRFCDSQSFAAPVMRNDSRQFTSVDVVENREIASLTPACCFNESQNRRPDP